MIALFNYNTYLGGGETLFVRFALYLAKHDIPFKLFFKKDSYIEKDLHREGIGEKHLFPISKRADYYYLSKHERREFINELYDVLKNDDNVHLVGFCTQIFYSLIDLAKRDRSFTITQLELHEWDNLYVCQTLWDKFFEKLTGRSKHFNNKKMIAFNANLFNKVNDSGGLIMMQDLAVNLWNKDFGIRVKKDKVVPLPVCDFKNNPEPEVPQNNHKIIWIGRIVDFKIPALCAMMNFVSHNPLYTLTVVGYGDNSKIGNYIKSNAIDTSRINFIGKVEYCELGNIIKQHSIGYAMGTSPVEIGKFGLPVILALASKTFNLFKRNICGGLMTGNVGRGNVGVNLWTGQSEDEQVTIEQTVEMIEKDYSAAAKSCYQYLKADFDIDTNLGKYMEIINASQPMRLEEIEIPEASWLRRVLFKRMG